jgi:hypothetical protein
MMLFLPSAKGAQDSILNIVLFHKFSTFDLLTERIRFNLVYGRNSSVSALLLYVQDQTAPSRLPFPDHPTYLNFYNIVGLRTEDVDQCDFVALFIRTNGIMQRYIFPRFFQRAQVHQNLILDTSRHKRSQFCTFVWRKRLDRFNQANCPDRDQILQIFPCVVEFFDYMNTKRCKSFAAVIVNYNYLFLHHNH